MSDIVQRLRSPVVIYDDKNRATVCSLKLCADAADEIEQLRAELITAHNAIISDVNQQRDLAECRRLLREICDAIDAAPSWPNPVLSRLGVEWHKDAIIQTAKAGGE